MNGKLDLLGYFIIFAVLVLCSYIYFDTESFQLKCVVSTVDGNEYCVRERDQVQKAADLLATVTEKCRHLVEYVHEKYPDRENVIRLYNGFNPSKVMETLPTSSYTAYSENKGEKIAFCLNRNSKSEEDNDNLIDEHTLTFVAIHELSHVATQSIGHKTEFWENFKFLLENAKECGVHDPVDYKKQPGQYCSLDLKDNPYYDV